MKITSLFIITLVFFAFGQITLLQPAHNADVSIYKPVINWKINKSLAYDVVTTRCAIFMRESIPTGWTGWEQKSKLFKMPTFVDSSYTYTLPDTLKPLKRYSWCIGIGKYNYDTIIQWTNYSIIDSFQTVIPTSVIVSANTYLVPKKQEKHYYDVSGRKISNKYQKLLISKGRIHGITFHR